MQNAKKAASQTERRRTGVVLLGGYLVLYASALTGMHSFAGFDITEPLFVLGILGVGFSLLAWLLTLGMEPLRYKVVQPKGELLVLVYTCSHLSRL